MLRFVLTEQFCRWAEELREEFHAVLRIFANLMSVALQENLINLDFLIIIY